MKLSSKEEMFINQLRNLEQEDQEEILSYLIIGNLEKFLELCRILKSF